MSTAVWFITGASSGFGRLMTEFVLKKGGIVVATLRQPDVLAELKAQYPPENLLILQLDVTKPEEIIDSFAKAEKAFGKIDVVFNNAGYALLAEVEGAPEDKARVMFDVNFWGATNVSKEAVRFFREVNKPAGGRLLNVSSIVGITTVPALGYYNASKHALEGITETLASELDPEWNIKITLVEFGGFETRGRDSLVRAPPHAAYLKPSLASAASRSYLLNKNVRISGDAGKAIAKVYNLAQLEDPPLRLPLGNDAVTGFREKVAKILTDVDKYKSWSEGLAINS
ncbi:hypothetical protein EW026_g7084 [Hermanssonia centrifuga]|uniref:NAD(P)-binding protein n=1 Tax=Hermanssonia centrifuga TaxID=98765 RepID=A0A4S4KAQ5_9APHY|nr:hypothetical protein EW026_g7084 [Hermanssonia centrifuga]